MDKFEALVNYITDCRDWCSLRLEDLQDIPQDNTLIQHLKTKHRSYCAILAYAKELRNQ